MRNESDRDQCSFCGWHVNAVSVLLESKDGRAFICDMCVANCVRTIADAKGKRPVSVWHELRAKKKAEKK